MPVRLGIMMVIILQRCNLISPEIFRGNFSLSTLNLSVRPFPFGQVHREWWERQMLDRRDRLQITTICPVEEANKFNVEF